MKPSDYKISLDILESQSQYSLPMKKGDTKRNICITLREGAVPYEISTDCFAVFSGKKSDGTVLENNCVISGNTIIYSITPQTTAVSGLVDCEIKLYGADSALVTSARFSIIVDERAVGEEEIESTAEFSALTKLYSETNTLKTEIEEKLANGDFKGDKGDMPLVDQTYDPTSDNAQSGIAVAQAQRKTIDEIDERFDISANLYNEKTNTDGYVVSSAGVLTENSGYTTTDYIHLKKGQYTMTYDDTHQFVFISKYNLNKEFIIRENVLSGSFEITEDCYVRLSGYKVRLPQGTIMLVEGTELPTGYVPYSVKLKSEHLPEIESGLTVVSIADTDFIKTSSNLINQMTIEKNKVISATGVKNDSVEYHITDKIYLKSATAYTAKDCFRISYFDEQDNHLKAGDLNTSRADEGYTFTTLDNFAYAIVSLYYNANIDYKWQLNEGSELLAYEPQHLIINGYRVYDEPDVEVDTIAEFREKDRIVFDKAPLFTLDNEVDGIEESQKNSTSIFAMYDALMSENPIYITKIELGSDSQGNMLYRYDFKKPDMYIAGTGDGSNSKSKVILVSGIHGNEYTGIFSLFNTMKQIATNPNLEKLKNDVHFIVVPIINIYGVNNNTRANENGINMARNFEVGFSANTGSDTLGYSGATPLTENGCKYIDQIMKENSDAILFTSCHNFAGTNTDTPKRFLWAYCDTKYFDNLAEKTIVKLSQEWGKKYDNLLTEDDYVLNSGGNRYVGYKEMAPLLGTENNQASKYGIQSGIIEMCDRFWFESDTPETETPFVVSRGTETVTNLILAHIYNYEETTNEMSKSEVADYINNVIGGIENGSY